MPKTKASKRRANLGAYAKKKPHPEVTVEESDGESGEFSGALSDVEAPVSTLVPETDDSEGPDDVLAWNDEDVEDLASHLRSSFMRRLQNALRAQEATAAARTRPEQYNKIHPTSRTTISSRQQKIKKQTVHLRANGYPDIRTFWPQVPPSHEAEPSPIEVISDSDSESQGLEADTAPGERFMSALGLGGDLSDVELESRLDSPSGNLEGDSDTEMGPSGLEHLNVPEDQWSRSLADSESCPNEENEIPAEEVLDSPTTHTEPQTPGLLMAEQPPANHQPVPSRIAQPAPQQGAPLLALKLVDIPMGPAWCPPPKDSKAITEAVKALPVEIKNKELHPNVRGRLVAMLAFLRYYANSTLSKSWTEASDLAAIAILKIHCRNAAKALIEDDEIRQDLQLHLLGIGKYFTAADVVEYSGRPEKGCYIDGHERKDVVDYRQDIFLAKWFEHERKMTVWDKDGKVTSQPEPELTSSASPTFYRIVPVTHDESTFYAHDQRKTRWIPLSEGPVPVRKGDGTSLMVSDFCSPDLPGGWLRSKDGKQEARLFFKAGKNRDGYFTNDDILETTRNAIDLFETHFPPGSGVKALFMFDNAKTHQKRAPNALSARKMPKSTRHWPPSGPKMRDATFNGKPQPLYFPDDHPDPEKAGRFKGMKVILQERNLWPSGGLKAECEGFRCTDPDRKLDCCAHRLLFNQPDFKNQKSLLQELVEGRGHEFLFYPKFHCELNFIEMCWGRAKYAYRMYGIPRNEAQQEQYVRRALDSVPYQSMQRFATRSARFMGAYRQGLSGSQAAWANRKYHSHRTLPAELVSEIKEKIK